VPAARPVGFALIFKVAGVGPLAGVTVSHAPPEAAAAIVIAEPLLVTERFCVPVVLVPVG
jgi:hypothetical protein